MEKVIKRCFISTIIIFIVYILILIYGAYDSGIKSGYAYSFSFSIFIIFLIPYNIFIILIYLLEVYNKILYAFTLLIIIGFFSIIELNANDFDNYENWQYYNRQTILSDNLDYFIGKNLLELYFLLKIILVSYTVSIIILIYETIKKRFKN
ncbi:hypothetical protein [Bergeyella zoohelcum]|uniref:Uncharacterized protein n=1 Tax=Bergeyella zoohelcum TaxID=1015 RepID=A0A7Z8YNX5_9FLAO|nr:hypothetical protein [Bergeyella zoohelcum]VDH02632.1 Uncharacterised protein [Bergeyella zoohelcum]